MGGVSTIAAGEIPLVGRDQELLGLVSGITGEERASYVVAGAAGVGKTRLVSEVARKTRDRGLAVLHVTATKAAGSVPFGVFAPFLTEMPDASSPAHQLRLASEQVAGRFGDGAGLLAVDDAHLLDHCSSALVHLLVHDEACGVLASLRSRVPAPDSVTSLWKDGLAVRVDLQPLGEDEVAELAASALGAPMAGTGVRWLWEATNGNPLHVRELILAAVESDALHQSSGIWVLRHPVPATARLADVVAQRINELEPATRQVLDVLAIAEPLELTLVEVVCGSEAVEESEHQGLVVVSDVEGRTETTLGHPFYGDVLRQQMPRSRRRRLAAFVARALQESGAKRESDLLRLATLQVESGSAGDPEVLERAATVARSRFDLRLAADLARAALAAGAGWTANFVLAEVELLSGRSGEAEAIFAELEATCASDAQRTLVAQMRSYNLGERMGDRQAATTVLDTAIASVRDATCRGRLECLKAQIDLIGGELDAAIDLGSPLLDAEDATLALRSAYIVSIALALRGRTAEALEVAVVGEQALARCDEDRRPREATLTGATLANLFAGNLAAAKVAAELGYGIALDLHDEESIATYATLRGWVMVERGRVKSASTLFREAIAVSEASGNVFWRRVALGGLALSEGMAGSAVSASAAVVEVDGLPPSWMTFLEVDLVDRGRAWSSAAAGQISQAREILREAAARARAGGLVVTEARLLHDMVRLGDPQPPTERMAALAREADGALVPALATHAAAGRAGHALRAATERFEEIGAHLLAAEAATAAATALRGEGSKRYASQMDRTAARLWDMCEDARTPARVAADPGAGASLTAREREIALLASLGRSSRDIADHLCISVRTVENHLQHVYDKLGVTAREDLAGALAFDGSAPD